MRISMIWYASQKWISNLENKTKQNKKTCKIVADEMMNLCCEYQQFWAIEIKIAIEILFIGEK